MNNIGLCLVTTLLLSGCLSEDGSGKPVSSGLQSKKINQEFVDVLRCMDIEFALHVKKNGYKRSTLKQDLDHSFDQCGEFVDMYLSNTFERLRVQKNKNTLPSKEIHPTVKETFKTKFIDSIVPVFTSVYETKE